MKNFREIEQLSSYLDGQLSPSESARLEARLASDPELASAFNDIRAARGILRKLPARKAPRNFTLTRQMVGLKPPLPRSYSFFRFSTAFATVLLVLTFAANALTQLPVMSSGTGASAPQGAYGLGGGGGGNPIEPSFATEAPAATEAPMATAPSLEMAVAPTETLPATNADSARVVDTPTVEAPTAKEAETPSEPQGQPQVQSEAIIPVGWQIALLVLGLVSGVFMLVLRRSAKRKWQ